MTEDAKLLDYLKRATSELRQTRRQLREAEARGREPLAIVAMSCRFPGGVESPEALWDLVAAGGDAISGFPADRGWDLDALYDPDPERSGTSYVREGGFLPDAGEFDAELFGISPREALSMDPQQRLLLETSWQLFERAGLDPHGLAGSRVGVFVGTNGQDYAHRFPVVPEEVEGYALTGNAASVASGRVAYVFGLEGPAVTVDTACSSSLVAMHMAAQALRAGECSLALAGGVSVMSTPRTFVEFSRQRGLAPDGRCKAFAAAADGTGWGEGVGLVLLERLSDAVANGHRVLAVLRGSAVNQDGASNGLTAPNGPSQQRVIRQALASAGLSAGDVDVVEAHGTGTRLGDPIEAQALLATYGQDRPEGRPLWLGSVKSNIGHTQAAAGVAGVIKMVMAMRHGQLPETLHVDEPSPHVDWSAGDVRLLTEPVPWPGEGRVRRAGVSSFGVSGTNAHVILEEPPAVEAVAADAVAGSPMGEGEGPVPWVVSGRGDAGLRGQAARLASFVRERQAAGAVDRDWLAGAAAGLVGRARLDSRAVVVGADVVELVAGLEAVAGGVAVEGVVAGSPVVGKTAVLFTGQGSQFAGMGARLYERFEVFAGVVDEVCGVADGLLPEPLRPVLFGEAGRGDLVDETVFAQVGLVALEVGLWHVLTENGLRADVLVGHSVGEISAAVAAGVLSLGDAVRLACVRGALMQGLAGGGVMVSVAAPAEEVRERVAGLAGVWVAAVNGPESVVVAGAVGAVRGVVEKLDAEGVRTRWLPVSHAFHTPLMDPMVEEFSAALADLSFGPAQIPVVSTVSGELAGADFGSAGYWVEHVRKPVRFTDALETARGLGGRVWAEVGPQPALSAAMVERAGEVVASFMRRERDQVTTLLTGLARLHVHGVEVDWDRWVPRTREPVEVPTYAFQRRRYWLEAPASPVAGAIADPVAAEFWEAVERNDLEALGLAEGIPSDGVLPVLSAWRRGYQERRALADWRYHVTWKPLPEPTTATPLTGTWLVVGHDEDVLAPLAAMVHSSGARAEVLTVEPRTGRATLADRLRAVSANAVDLSGVLSALALPGGATPGDWTATADSLALVQALGDAGVTAPLWCLTSGAVGTGGDDPVRAPEAAALWGLGRVAALEHPDRWGGLVDLPADPDASAYQRLGLVLTGVTGEDQVAVRATRMLGCRLRRATTPTPGEQEWSPAGSALITGGTGALGGHVARLLAERGAEHIVLLSRQGPDAPGADDLRRDLEAHGTRVTLRACDISRRAELAEAIAAVPAEYPLTTVVHGAAVLDDAPLSALTPERLSSVLDAKATSARYLDELTRDLPLVSFVLFSAFGGVLGSAGQGNYAAANAVLDALAEQRRAAGLPATAIAWGAWAGDGMAARSAATVQRLRRTGVRSMAPELALAALGRALGAGETTVLVADVDWSRFTPAFTATRPSMLLADLPDARGALVPGGASTADGTVPALSETARRLVALPASERHAAVLDLVRDQVAAVLGHADPAAVGSDRLFRELGFDSLTGLDLRNRLTVATGLTLPATLVFDHPTVGRLTARLDAELGGGATDAPQAQADEPVPVAPVPDTDEPIAIVAVACRLPGGVRSPEELWTLLADGVDAMSEFPTDRGWDLSRLYAPETDGPGTSYVRHGGFLSDAAQFDAAFFGISPREALAMDPQQRLLLETSWEVLERAGIDPLSLRGSRTGVFAGTNGQDYAALLTEVPDGEDFAATGNAASVLSGRVAYALGLEGPAVTVDTACSASLVSIHLAGQALRRRECSLALAGGVTVMSTPNAFVTFSRQRGLAPDGRCKPFSARADGTAWGEGVAVLLLERLSDARRHGHPVLALVRGSAVNQDGASNGLTAPNGPSQQRVIRSALADGALTPADVDAVEAHGTGTVLGDPIEAQALIAAYGDRPADRPLRIGSIKSNIGHTQAAAGAAGVIKMVLALRHGLLPRTLHAEEASPHVDWSAGAVSLLTEAVPWDRHDRPRRAGVSSFGVSGTNAHLVIEEAPVLPAPDPHSGEAATGGALPGDAQRRDGQPEEAQPGDAEPGEALPFLLSARDDATVAAQAARLHEHLAAHPDLTLPDVAHALATSRAALEHRAVVLAQDRDELLGTLTALADGAPAPAALRGVAGEGRVAVLFPGQGSQSAGMGRALYGRYPDFAACLDEVCAAFAPELERPLLDVVHAEPGTPEADLLHRTHYTQPALFAVEVALYRLLEGWGLRPDYLLGHSIGELAAAHVAGVLTLPEAARLVAARGRLMQALPEGGAMIALAAAPDDLAPLLDGHRDRVDIAAVNGPAATVLSGDEDAVRDIAERCAARGIKHRRLNVSHAFHSSRMDGMLPAFGELASRLDLAPARIPIVSNVTGVALTAEEATTPEYWVRHVRETVRFHDGIRWLHSRGVTVFVELGPDGVLSAMGAGCLPDAVDEVAFVPTLRPSWPEPRAVTAALGELHTRGVPLDWPAIATGWGGRPVPLPTYPFRRRRYWPEATPAPVAGADPADTRFWTAVDRQDIASLTGELGVAETAALPELLPALAAWRERRHTESAVQDWRYRIDWRGLTDLPRPRPTGSWIVVSPSAPEAAAETAGVLAALARRGVRAHLLTVGPDGDADAGTALRDALGTADAPPAGVLSLLALDRRPHPRRPELTTGLTGTVRLIQALAGPADDTESGTGTRLWCVTRGAVAADRTATVTDPAQAQVWGLGRVAALEHPRQWGGLADLPAEPDDTAYDRLCAVVTGDTGEDQVAIRPDGVLGRRLTRAAAPTTTGGWQPRGTVLITGGTGGIGAHVARRLADDGADHLVLVSRSGADSPEAARLVAELGSRVTIAACDVTDRHAVTDLVARMSADGHPIRAVLHAAGISRHASLAETTPDEIADTLTAKTTGAAVLHEVFAGTELDAFVLFSSIAGVWGSGGQAAYAAANAYLDALAEHRRAQGLPATSVAWGAWAGIGMATVGDAAEQLRQRGITVMDPDRAVVALRQAIAEDEPQVTVADVDWDRFVPLFTGARPSPLLAGLPEAARQFAGSEDDSAPVSRGELGRRVAALPEADGTRLLLDLVRAEAAGVLGHTDPDEVDAGRAFRSLGFDSLTSIQLRDRLAVAIGTALPATLVFDHPNPAVLAGHLRDTLLGLRPEQPQDSPVRSADGDDPIVIVGMSCRFPGRVESPEELWDLVASGGDAISGFPTDRGWDLDALYDPDPERSGTSYAREGGFLADAGDFDAGFFGISPREALAMDPQQRLLLEVTWEALERAQIAPDSLRTSPTGVFMGTSGQDYMSLPGDASSEGYFLTGNAASVVSGRLAYVFGLEGPAVTVDTACSSSLVAMHLAAQALRAGECGLALAGGVAVMSTPGAFVEFSRQRGLAPDGRCKPFAAGADGTGWAEGVGVLLLERLSDAVANGHRVLAVVRGSAVNQDGASNGLTAPNGPSQQRVIRQALASAGLSAGEVDVVEAHGTGTRLGDPIEAQALLATYGQERPEDRPLWLGSVKSNIGHTQAAAGVAGVIKMVMAMRHGQLPETLHVDEPSPHVDWTAGDVRLLTKALPWSREGGPRRAGVSSFGVSGTNAHLILEEPPAVEPAVATVVVSGPVPWLVSGRGDAGLRGQAARLAEFLRGREEVDVAGVAAALAGRAVLEDRAVVVGADVVELVAGLEAVAGGVAAEGVVAGSSVVGRTAVLFTGQGSQFAGMGARLYERFEVFAGVVDEVCAVADGLLPEPLRPVLFGEGGRGDRIDETVFAQVGLVALEVGLWRVLTENGLRADVLVGHSVGEISAAVAAGVLSLGDAVRLACVRGQLMQGLAGGGVMVSVAAPAAEIQERVSGLAGVWVAAVNGPESVVLAGAAGAVRGVVEKLDAEGVRTRWLPVSHAFHTPLMDPMLEDFSAALADLSFGPAQIPVVSTVSGELAGADFGSAGYWVEHVRQPVRFADALDTARGLGARLWAEVGPQPALSAAAAEREGEVFVSFMRRERDQVTSLLTGLARLHVHGVEVDWDRWVPRTREPVEVPTYAFQRRRFWAAGSGGASVGSLTGAGLAGADHRLLGARVSLAGGGVVFTGRLSVSAQPWLADHAVSGVVVLPGTAFVDFLAHAGLLVGSPRVRELTLHAPLVLGEDGPGVMVQVVVDEPDEHGQRAVGVYSRLDAGDGEWIRHGTGALAGPADTPDVALDWPPVGEPAPAEAIYAGLSDAGFDYGPVFQGLKRVWVDGGDVYAEVVLPDDPSGFALHPALLDAALHALAAADGAGEGGLPFAFTGVTVHNTGARTLHTRLRRGADGVTVEAVDPTGRPVVTVESLTLRPVSEAPLHPAQDAPLRMRWDQVAVIPDGLPAVPGDCALVPAGHHAGVADVVRAVDDGATAPAWVVLDLPDSTTGSVPERARAATEWVLLQVQEFLAAPALADTRMVIRTTGAVVTGPGDRNVDPAVTAVWGLARSAVAENPGRIHLLDTADTDDVPVGGLLAAVHGAGREQVALRKGALLAPRLVEPADDVLSVPEGANWRLAPGGQTLDGLSLAAGPAAPDTLAPGQVRVAVRAAGLNFRDVMVALGMYPGRAALGAEGAGVVTEVGPDVTGTAVGDRVFGLMPECFGPSAVADARMLAVVPQDWSFAEAASVPIVFLTAWYALRDLADLRPGERVLIHAGAGGVGMAAIQLARHLGAEVFATAHPTKWGTLRALGVAEDHMASSRDLDFRDRFAALTEGHGVDVVLNSLAGEFVDASLDLLPRGGRFVEMGKTDVRTGDEVPAGVTYRTFDLADPEPERIGAMLSEVIALLRRGALDLLPITTWDIREAPAAFRHLGQAKHTGKLVLTVPAPLAPAGTVLVTGGTGTLGALLTRHLVAEYGVRHLLLASRQGPAAPGAAELVEELRRSGAEARVVACDVSRRDEVAALLDAVDPDHPLTGVLHAAGVADDAVIGSLTPQRLAAVLAAKADSAWHLHELTRGADLAMFTLFSSAAGVLGAPGQGNYAAANTFLDALAEHRHARGLPAQSHSWGLWAQRSGISGHLTEGDLARITASGMVPLSTEDGLRLWDRAQGRADHPHLVLLQLDPRHRPTHPLLSGPAAPERTPRARNAAAPGQGEARDRLATLPDDERRRVLLGLVREHAAAVLGHPSLETVEDERAFKDLGFDSLTGIELRNRLNAATGVPLRPTLVFDHPTPQLLAEHLDRQVTAGAAAPATTGAGTDASEDDLTEADFRRMLATIPIAALREAGLTGPLLRLARGDGRPSAGPEERPAEIDAMDADDLVRIALDTFQD